uniref:Uncharacterized protein n=1 Tax=Triticum urartu TaxID=4572 RepID=A0A8R7PQH7_TRIUA
MGGCADPARYSVHEHGASMGASSSYSLQPRARHLHAPFAGDHQPTCRLGTTCRWTRSRPAAARGLDLQ